MAALSAHLPGTVVLPCGVLLHLCMLCINLQRINTI